MNDLLKDDHCRMNSIDILWLPYWTTNRQIKDMVLDFLLRNCRSFHNTSLARMTEFTLDRISSIIDVARFDENATSQFDRDTDVDYKDFISRVILRCPEEIDTVIPLTLIYMHYIIEYEQINVLRKNINNIFAISFHMARKYVFRNCTTKRYYRNIHMSNIFNISSLYLFNLEQIFLRTF